MRGGKPAPGFLIASLPFVSGGGEIALREVVPRGGGGISASWTGEVLDGPISRGGM